ncbi:MAG: hypothetical protein H0T79_15870 [Deltaproteobacteria bacterium]|nr:hypothetical protein [Deltaproteobacteria bacterium]
MAATRCGNCGGFFSRDELLHMRPPPHPWKLTEAGKRALQANEALGGEHPACPGCGWKTLIGAAKVLAN